MKPLTSQLDTIFSKANRTDWELVKFGDVAHEVKDTSRDPISEGIERVVGLEHLTPLDIHIRSWGNIEDETTFTRKFKKGQVLFAKRRAYQRKAALAEFDGICSGDILVLEANEEKIEPVLLPFLMHGDGFYKWAVSTSAGSLSPRTKFKDLAEFKFHLPPRPIQKKIAELLCAIDGVSEKINKSLGDLHTYRHAFFEQVILSKDGTKITLKEIGDLLRGVGYKPTDVGNESLDGYYPILRSNNIQESGLTFDDLYYINKNRFKDIQLLKKEDIVICMSNGSKELVGKAARFESFKMPISFGSFCAAFRPGENKYAGLVKYLFQTNVYKKHIQLLLTGSNINNLKPSDIESITFQISDNALNEVNQRQLSHLDKAEKEMVDHLANTNNIGKNIVNRLLD